MTLSLRFCLLVVLLTGVLLGYSSLALSNPEELVTNVIKARVTAKYPQWANLKIEVAFKYADKIFAELKSLPENSQVKLLNVQQNVRPVGDAVFPLEVCSEKGKHKVFVRAKVSVFKNVVVAGRQIKRGVILAAEDLKLEEKDIATLPQRYFCDLRELSSAESRTVIPKASIVYDWMVKEIPLVRRGEKVKICMTAPHLLVRSEGVALTDGYRGKNILVKGKESKKNMEGILISKDEVEVRVE